MSKSGQKLVIGCAVCTALGAYAWLFFKADPQPSTASGPASNEYMRIKYTARDGTFLVYDAAIPRDDPDQDPRFLAYWRDYNEKASYVFGRQLFDETDMGHALLGLENEFRLDLDEFERADSRLRDAVAAARRDRPDDTRWEIAYQGSVAEIMGFDPRDVRDPDNILGDFDGDDFVSSPNDCGNDDGGIASSPPAPHLSPGGGFGGIGPYIPPHLNCCEFNCNDQNSCTNDYCTFGVCHHSNLSGTSCADGDDCTTPDHCEDGVCIPGPERDCDDANPCTADSCRDLAPNPDVPGGYVCEHNPTEGAPCDDMDPCTDYDECQSDGTCAGTENDCDDGIDCTVDFCDEGECIHNWTVQCTPPTDPCVNVNCSTGSCVEFRVIGRPCDDGEPCTINDVCTATDCIGEPNPCDSPDPCHINGHCVSGVGCQFENPCDDGEPCTYNSCNESTGACNNEPLWGHEPWPCAPQGCIVTISVPDRVVVNNDDDNGNGVSDWYEPGVPVGENDLAAGTITTIGCPPSG